MNSPFLCHTFSIISGCICRATQSANGSLYTRKHIGNLIRPELWSPFVYWYKLKIFQYTGFGHEKPFVRKLIDIKTLCICIILCTCTHQKAPNYTSIGQLSHWTKSYKIYFNESSFTCVLNVFTVE